MLCPQNETIQPMLVSMSQQNHKHSKYKKTNRMQTLKRSNYPGSCQMQNLGAKRNLSNPTKSKNTK